MSWVNSVKTALKTVLDGVANIGTVYKYRPYDQKAGLILTAFPDFTGAFIEFTGLVDEKKGNRVIHSDGNFTITLFAPVADAGESALAFDDVVEAAQDALRAADGLDVPGGFATVQNAGGIAETPALISNVLCHVATITFSCKRRIL